MDWQKLKKEIYYCDGSWRDIYILDTTQNDWKSYINFVNEYYGIEFFNGQTQKTEAKIDYNIILDYWTRKTDLMNSSVIKFDSININCHFFTDKEIENDIDPGNINDIEAHNKLIAYMTNISKILNKTVILTPENFPEIIHISADKDNVKISFNK